MTDIWIFVQQRDGEIEEITFGLVAEAKRLLEQLGEAGQVTAVALGSASESVLETLGTYGVNRVFICLIPLSLRERFQQDLDCWKALDALHMNNIPEMAIFHPPKRSPRGSRHMHKKHPEFRENCLTHGSQVV